MSDQNKLDTLKQIEAETIEEALVFGGDWRNA